jgi:hypothetical protein
MQNGLHTPQERFERLAIVALGTDNPNGLLNWRRHD